MSVTIKNEPGLKEAFSLLRLQNTNPFLVRRQQRTEVQPMKDQIKERNIGDGQDF